MTDTWENVSSSNMQFFFSVGGPALETARWEKKIYLVREHSMNIGCVAHVPPALTRVAAVIPFDKRQTWKRQTDISTMNSIMRRGGGYGRPLHSITGGVKTLHYTGDMARLFPQ